MKLYHQPRTRSSRVRWLLLELGAPHEVQLVNVFAGEGRRPEHLQVHPHGFVPALEDEGEVFIESAGICMDLADRFAGGTLAPALGTRARARYYEWMTYIPATVDPCLETIMFHTVFLPEAKRLPELVSRARKTWASKIEPRFRAALEGKTFLLEERFTAADVLAASALAWSKMAGVLSDDPIVTGYLERMTSRPAFGPAHS